MTKREKCRRNMLTCYRMMGVVFFKNAVLCLEDIIHWKSGKRNNNYHVKINSIKSVKKFTCYLFYNSFVHFMSLLFTVLYFVLSVYGGVRIVALDAVIYIITVINVYCILLQHYNYLRIMDLYNQFWLQERKFSIKNKNEIKQFLAGFSERDVLEDLDLLNRIYDSIKRDEHIYIDKESIAGLERMSACLALAGYGKDTDKRDDKIITGALPCLNEIVGSVVKAARPYGKLEIKIQWLFKNILRKKDMKPTNCAEIITADAMTEKMYSQVFEKESFDMTITTIHLLREIYKSGEMA